MKWNECTIKGKERIKKVFTIAVVIVLIIGLTPVIFDYLSNERDMVSDYYKQEEKFELLQALGKKVIEEGNGIDIKKIPNEIQYHIYNNDENIIFYYYLKEDSTIEEKADVRITLSKDFCVLEEEHGFKTQSLEEYMENRNSVNGLLAACFICVVVCLICLIALLIECMVFLIKKCINSKQ